MIKSITTFSDIIIYWDLSNCTSEDERYFVYLNGEYVLTTNKTHFTIRDIDKNNVTIEIFTDENKKNCFHRESFLLTDKPRFIDISRAPYNAVGDGKTINTSAIQKAIDDCRENDCVYIPKGEFLTGALNLHSNMELYIENGGTLQGSEEASDYLPKIWSRFEGIEMECFSSLINIGNISNRDEICCENIIIHGGGKISGGGKVLADNVINYEKNSAESFRKRPRLINISCSQNVVIDNIEIANGACWNIHMLYSDNVVTCNSNFYSYGVSNGDGWDPDSSTNCTLFNCHFNTGDDCVAIKSGKNPEGSIIAKPCEDIRIFDCSCTEGHGFAIGSEMSGGISNVYIWDCDMKKSIFGLELKATKKRGGYVKNIHVSRCRLPRLMMHSVPYNDDGEAAPTVPEFSDCVFENLTICGEAREWGETEIKPCAAIELIGFGEGDELKNILFKNITIDNEYESVEQCISLQALKNVTISNLSVR